MAEKGQFIVFEGADGTGKTTALNKVAEQLRADGHEVVVTREPGGTPFAERVRELVLLPPEGAFEREPESDMLLIYAARTQHLESVIIPALKRGAVVLCDRFSASTFAYQVGAGRGDPKRFWMLEANFVNRQPDAYLYLTAPIKERLVRMKARKGDVADRYDDVAELIREPLDTGYERFMQEAPLRNSYQQTRFARIDAGQDVAGVRDECLQVIRGL